MRPNDCSASRLTKDLQPIRKTFDRTKAGYPRCRHWKNRREGIQRCGAFPGLDLRRAVPDWRSPASRPHLRQFHPRCPCRTRFCAISVTTIAALPQKVSSSLMRWQILTMQRLANPTWLSSTTVMCRLEIIATYLQRVIVTRVPLPGVDSISNSLTSRFAPPKPRPIPFPEVYPSRNARSISGIPGPASTKCARNP